MQDDIAERISNLEYRLGVHKNGTRNGNGVLHSIDLVNKEIANISSYIDDQKIEKIELNNRLVNIEKDMKQVQESLKAIENGLKDTINTKSFINFKNILLGIVAVLGGVSALGAFLYSFLKMIYERGN